MKSRNREINVFSMSALDLFASALGAFILISIVLMPYFLRLSDEEVRQLRQALSEAQASLREMRQQLGQAQSALQQCEERVQECRQQLAELQAEVDRLRAALERAQSERDQAQSALQQCQEELNACEERLTTTFLTLVIQWPSQKHDVDLHIIDAAGREFYFSERTIPGRPGELRWDSQHGPGVEIWEVSEAPPGEYRILYNLFDPHGNTSPPVVRGGISYRDGHHRFGDRRLTRVGRANAMLVAVVTVNDDGTVDIVER